MAAKKKPAKKRAAKKPAPKRARKPRPPKPVPVPADSIVVVAEPIDEDRRSPVWRLLNWLFPF